MSLSHSWVRQCVPSTENRHLSRVPGRKEVRTLDNSSGRTRSSRRRPTSCSWSWQSSGACPPGCSRRLPACRGVSTDTRGARGSAPRPERDHRLRPGETTCCAPLRVPRRFWAGSHCAISARARLAARDITARGGRLRPSARHAATVLRRCAAMAAQHSQARIWSSICRRRADVTSPSRYRESSTSSFRQRVGGRRRTFIVDHR